MSLKDRLKSAQKPAVVEIQKEQQKPKYFSSNEDANQFDTLGVLDAMLYDEDINSIFVSGAKNIYIEKRNKVHKSTSTFRDNIQLENIIKKNAQLDLDENNNSLNCFKFNHKLGINVLATLPPLSSCPTMHVKCYYDKHATMQVLQQEYSISKEMALVLEALCAIKRNVLIVGEKSTLKTTLLSTLAKKVPNNNRIAIIDNQREIEINIGNYTNYDFTQLNDKKTKQVLLNSIVATNPDKIFINDDENLILAEIIANLPKYKGIVASICAINPNEAIETLIKTLMEVKPSLTYEKAKANVLASFDVVIQVTKDDISRRRISSISQINLLSEDFVEKIFEIDYLHQHKSCGIIPVFYEDIKENSLPISENIFDESYKHTYHKGIDRDALLNPKTKSGNIEILKKFKKDLPTKSEEENTEVIEEASQVEETPELTPDELMKRAQEKFNEIRNNIQNNKEDEVVFEEIFSEENLSEEQNENL